VSAGRGMRWWRRAGLVRRPWVSALTGACLLGALVLSPAPAIWGAPFGRTMPRIAATVTLVDEGGAYRALDLDAESADELAMVLGSAPETVVTVTIFRRSRAFGLIFGVAVRERSWVSARRSGDVWEGVRTPREVLDATAAALERDGASPAPAWIPRGEERRTRVLWRGIAGTAAWFAALAVFVASLGWIGDRRRARRLARLGKGACPQCGYDLRGTTGAADLARCPECGAERGGAGQADAGSWEAGSRGSGPGGERGS